MRKYYIVEPTHEYASLLVRWDWIRLENAAQVATAKAATQAELHRVLNLFGYEEVLEEVAVLHGALITARITLKPLGMESGEFVQFLQRNGYERMPLFLDTVA